MQHDRFQHWPNKGAGVTVIDCSAPKLYYGAAGTCEPGHRQLLREVWEGGNAAITLSQNPCCVKVSNVIFQCFGTAGKISAPSVIVPVHPRHNVIAAGVGAGS